MQRTDQLESERNSRQQQCGHQTHALSDQDRSAGHRLESK